MLPRFIYVLPFHSYCWLAYPALLELLKSRYEQNLGGPAIVRACVPIRWEHDDKNLSNACRSCHSMHNNPGLCGWKKNTLRHERRVLKKGVFWWWICIRCLDSPFWQTWMINIAQHCVSNKETKQGLVCIVCSYLQVDKVFMSVYCIQARKCTVNVYGINYKCWQPVMTKWN